MTSLGWSRGRGQVLDTAWRETDPDLTPELTEVATGVGLLLSGGERRDWNHEKLERGRSCTAVGLSWDRKRFLFVVSDRGVVCTGRGIQDVLLAHGISDAIHLDGGGSAKMWIQGRGYVNDEPQDRQPPVSIYARTLR